jgi:hypothetical protein
MKSAGTETLAPTVIQEAEFAPDSPLEEAVSSELVSRSRNPC